MLLSEKLKKNQKKLALITFPIFVVFFIIGILGYFTDIEVLVFFLFLAGLVILCGLFINLYIMYKHHKTYD